MNRQQRKTRRNKNRRGDGLRLEKRVAKEIRHAVPGEVFCGQWIEYLDENGLGYAQPDIFILQEDQILLLEVKLTQTENGWAQMEDLYEPLLHHIYGLPVHQCLVCQNLRWTPDILVDAADEIQHAGTWHFL